MLILLLNRIVRWFTFTPNFIRRIRDKFERIGPALFQTKLDCDLMMQPLNLINGQALGRSRSRFVCFGNGLRFGGNFLAVSFILHAQREKQYEVFMLQEVLEQLLIKWIIEEEITVALIGLAVQEIIQVSERVFFYIYLFVEFRLNFGFAFFIVELNQGRQILIRILILKIQVISGHFFQKLL